MLLDSAVDRVETRLQADFDSTVNAVRVGSVIARDRRAASRWDRQVARRNKTSAGLSGAALETAVASLAATHPEYVVSS
jgi:hypothetical protein